MTSPSTANAGASDNASPWMPFHYPAFALLWTATLISNTGTWMHDVGAGWLMTTLDPSPAIVSLVQAATTLPIFLFALFAGALADRLDKKRMLIVINLIMCAIISVLSVLVALELITPSLLLLITFALGTGAAFMAPAWQAIVPSLVPRPQLQPAIALNSLGINISRAIGPALAGFLIAAIGLAGPFALNAASHLVIIAALLLWRPEKSVAGKRKPEPIGSAMLIGLRHASHNPALRQTLVRALGFFIFASAYWAMLPLIARGLDGGAQLYGIMLGCVGAGAVAGALVLPRWRKKYSADKLVLYGTVATAVTMALFAVAGSPLVALPASLLAGASWITVLTSLNVSAQMSLPNWIRARGLAIYMMVFFGSLSAGSTLWGQVASFTSVGTALIAAAVLLLAAIPLTAGARLGQGDNMDLTPSSHWPEPLLDGDIDGLNDRGPVLVTVDYKIPKTNENEFLLLMQELARERYRDGAYEWGLYQNTEQGREWIEWFLTPNWEEHLRQHERVTASDRALQERIRSFHSGDRPPRVRHFLAGQVPAPPGMSNNDNDNGEH